MIATIRAMPMMKMKETASLTTCLIRWLLARKKTLCHLIPASGSGGHTKNDTGTTHVEDIAAETEQYVIEVELVEEQESKCDLDVLATGMDTPIMATKETLNENEKARHEG